IPDAPSWYWGRNVTTKPIVHSQKCVFARASLRRRPVTLGNQNVIPAHIANTDPPTSTLCRCATTKYVSWNWKSIGADASITPVIPPNRNVNRKPTDHSIGAGKVSRPPIIVKIQLKNLMPVGTAMRNDVAAKNGRFTAPVVNMWWAHTVIEYAPMSTVAN